MNQTDNCNRAYYNGSGGTAIGGFSPVLVDFTITIGDTLQPWAYSVTIMVTLFQLKTVNKLKYIL